MNRGIDHGDVFFRGRFHSRLITDDAHLVAAARYIHRNALDIEGVGSVRNYRWSSHRAYLGLRTPPSWLRTDHVFEGWTAEDVDRFIEQPLHEVAVPADVDVPALVRAVELVLSERGLSSERRLGAVARQLALVWFVEEVSMPSEVVMAVFGIDRLGTLRTAISRARALVSAEPGLLDAQQRAVSLLSAASVTSRV